MEVEEKVRSEGMTGGGGLVHLGNLPGRDEMGWIGWAAVLLKLLVTGLHCCYWDAPAANLLLNFFK